jgi:hypothetical protein
MGRRGWAGANGYGMRWSLTGGLITGCLEVSLIFNTPPLRGIDCTVSPIRYRHPESRQVCAVFACKGTVLLGRSQRRKGGLEQTNVYSEAEACQSCDAPRPVQR